MIPVLLAPGLTPVSVLIAAVTVGPAWAAVIAATDHIVHGGEPTVRSLLRGLVRHATAGVTTALVPAVPAALALLSLTMYGAATPRPGWLLMPAGLATTTATLAVLASHAAFGLRITGGLRGRDLWLTALALTARAPAIALGIVAVVFLGFLAGTGLTASLLLLLPGPVALLTSAGVWTIARRHFGLSPHRDAPASP